MRTEATLLRPGTTLTESTRTGTPDDVAMLTLRTIPMTDRFRAEFPATPEALASMRAVLRRWLRHIGGDEQQIAEVVTACGEAATNAIEHAGAGGGLIEFAFRSSLGGIIPAEYFAATLIWWRFYTFYILLILGAFVAGRTVMRALSAAPDAKPSNGADGSVEIGAARPVTD